MKKTTGSIFSAAVRRTFQLATVLFVLYGATAPIWRNYKVAHNNPRIVGLIHGELWKGLYQVNEWLLSLWGEPMQASVDFLGMPWALRLFGVPIADPIVATTHTLTTQSLSFPLLLAVMIPIFLAITLGKVFCSHLCPMRALFEVGQLLRGGLLWIGIWLPAYRSPVRLGGWILFGGLLASVFSGFVVWYALLPYVDLGAAIFLLLTAGTTGGLLLVPGVLLFIDVVFAPGYFCHNLCPQGFLLEKLGQRSLLRIRASRKVPCPDSCNVCQLVCPYSLKPNLGTHRPACDNCAACVTSCPKRKLSRHFHLPVLTSIIVFALGTLVSENAKAHHNKGLPHYGYYDNYPQVPTEESVVIRGTWEMGSTIFNFQGYDRKDASAPNDVKFFIYLYDLKRDTNYKGPLEFQIRQGDQVVSSFRRDGVDEEMIYSTRETLPASGEYELVVLPQAVGGPKKEIVLPFRIDLGDRAVSSNQLLSIGEPVGILFVLALLGRTRRGRARRLQARPVEGAAS